MNTSFDKDKVGTYDVEYTVKDLDGNESSYIVRKRNCLLEF